MPLFIDRVSASELKDFYRVRHTLKNRIDVEMGVGSEPTVDSTATDILDEIQDSKQDKLIAKITKLYSHNEITDVELGELSDKIRNGRLSKEEKSQINDDVNALEVRLARVVVVPTPRVKPTAPTAPSTPKPSTTKTPTLQTPREIVRSSKGSAPDTPLQAMPSSTDIGKFLILGHEFDIDDSGVISDATSFTATINNNIAKWLASSSRSSTKLRLKKDEAGIVASILTHASTISGKGCSKANQKLVLLNASLSSKATPVVLKSNKGTRAPPPPPPAILTGAPSVPTGAPTPTATSTPTTPTATGTSGSGMRDIARGLKRGVNVSIAKGSKMAGNTSKLIDAHIAKLVG